MYILVHYFKLIFSESNYEMRVSESMSIIMHIFQPYFDIKWYVGMENIDSTINNEHIPSIYDTLVVLVLPVWQLLASKAVCRSYYMIVNTDNTIYVYELLDLIITIIAQLGSWESYTHIPTIVVFWWCNIPFNKPYIQ